MSMRRHFSHIKRQASGSSRGSAFHVLRATSCLQPVFVFVFVFVFVHSFVSCTESDDPAPYTASPVKNFEALWTLLDERYCFFDYKAAEYGLDWQKVHDRYAPLVNDTLTPRQLFDVLSSMVNELRDGHTNLIWDFATSSYDNFCTDYPHNFDSDLQLRTLGDSVYRTGKISYTKLPGTVGYMYISSFSNAISSRLVTELFHYFESCKGMIIDVRDNGGGSLETARGLAARFCQEKTLVGYVEHKTGPGHNDFSEPAPVYMTPDTTLSRWDKPVCVLCNRYSYSATNDFVRNMRLLPQVTIMGDRTGGGSGLPMSTELPNGWSLRYSSSPMLDVNMLHTEFGIDPDVFVSLDPDTDIDGIIEQARQRILMKSGK